MPYSDVQDKRAANARWMAENRKKKRTQAGMTLAERIKAAKQLAADAGLKPTAPKKVQPK